MEVKFSPERVEVVEPQVLSLIGGDRLSATSHRKFIDLVTGEFGNDARNPEDMKQEAAVRRGLMLYTWDRRAEFFLQYYDDGGKNNSALLSVENTNSNVREVISNYNRNSELGYTLYTPSFARTLQNPDNRGYFNSRISLDVARISTGQNTPTNIKLDSPGIHQCAWDLVRIGAGLEPRFFPVLS